MKSLLLCSALICFAATAQPVFQSPTTGPNNLGSPSAYYESPGPPSYIPLGDGNRLLDEANTAPTPIPDDMSLILTPNNNPLRQAQEEEPFDLEQMLESQRGGRGEGINQSIEPNSFETYPEKVR
jgi:hypothetical protein